MRHIIWAFVVFSFSSLHAQAARLDAYLDNLKNVPVDWVGSGAVCEQVARIEMAKQYPEDRYETLTGVTYGHPAATIGELDVVVFDKQSHNVIVVAEVKCWKDLEKAHAKAMEQHDRFLRALQVMPKMIIYHQNISYTRDQFSHIERYLSISQQGGESAGFDISLDYTLDELMALRETLIGCQQQGKCVAPAPTVKP